MIEHDPNSAEPLPCEDIRDSATGFSDATATSHAVPDGDSSRDVDQPRSHPLDSRLAANDATGATETPPTARASRRSRASPPGEVLARSAAKIAEFEQRREARIARELRQLADMKRRHHEREVADRKRDRRMRTAEENRARYRFADVLVQRMAVTGESGWGSLIADALGALSERDNAVLAAIIEQQRVRQAADS